METINDFVKTKGFEIMKCHYSHIECRQCRFRVGCEIYKKIKRLQSGVS